MGRILNAALAVIIAGPTIAQDRDLELRRLSETAEAMQDVPSAAFYVTARCGGLYDGLLGYGGDSLPENLRKQYSLSATVFTFASALIRVENAHASGRGSRELDPNIKQAFEESERFKAIYLERFRVNYELRGSMLEGDQLSKDDITFCQEMFPAAEARASKALGRDVMAE